MSSYIYWTFGLIIGYTIFLILVSRIAKSQAQYDEGFFLGGRSFNRWTVAFCITGLFSGSTFISILELSYFVGISSMWYGIAELTHILIIAFLIIEPLKKKKMVTISGLIGDRYGRMSKGISGIIIGFTFPIWSVATALAFASSINALTGLDLSISVAITALLLYLFLQAGGMWSVALTQTINFFAIIAMLAVTFYAFVINPGFKGLSLFATQKPYYFSLDSVGLQTILVWFGTFWFNCLLAQAALQMVLSSKSSEEGRKGLYLAAGFSIVFIIIGVITGISAAAILPGQTRGLVAIPLYLVQTLPAPLTGIFILGLWACALGWGAPCQFSGATSLGRDVGQIINPLATETQVIKYTKWSLGLLTCLMILFGFLRTEQAAWWNVFAWTVRNGAIFAPVAAALFWPAANKRGANAALVAGFSAGLFWNHLGGWTVESFFLNIHPVWVAMTINILIMTVFSLSGMDCKLSMPVNNRIIIGYIGLASTLLFVLIITLKFSWLIKSGLIGMFIFLSVLAVWLLIIAFIIPKEYAASEPSVLKHEDI